MGSYREGYERGLEGGAWFEDVFTEIFVNDKEYKRGFDAGIIEYKRRQREEELEENRQRQENERERRREENAREREEREREERENDDGDDYSSSYSSSSYYSPPPPPPPTYTPPVAKPTLSAGELAFCILLVLAVCPVFLAWVNWVETHNCPSIVSLTAKDSWVPLEVYSHQGVNWELKIEPETAVVSVRTPDNQTHRVKNGDLLCDNWSEGNNTQREWRTWFVSTSETTTVSFSMSIDSQEREIPVEKEAPIGRETGTGSGSTSGPETESGQRGRLIPPESFSQEQEKEKNDLEEIRNHNQRSSAETQTSVFVRRPGERPTLDEKRKGYSTNEQTSVFVRRPVGKTPSPESKTPIKPTSAKSGSITLSARNGWVPIHLLDNEEATLIVQTEPRATPVFLKAPNGQIFQTVPGQKEINWSKGQQRNREWRTWFVSTKSKDPVTLIVSRKTGR